MHMCEHTDMKNLDMCEHTDTKILDMWEHTDMKNLDLCRNSVSKVDSQTKKYPTADPLLAQTVDSLKKKIMAIQK